MVSPLKRRFKILFLVAISFLFAASALAQTGKYIRVAIIPDTASLSLKISGVYEVTDASGKRVFSNGRTLKTTVTAYREGILLAGKDIKTGRLLVKAISPDTIVINGRRFRGEILLLKKGDAHLMVINRIELEDYIKGILYHESSHYWPLEALKAQAIVCRTYAVYQMQENVSQDYDVTSDIYSQVYGGLTSERYRTNEAVEQTSGQVLVFQGKVFPAYYHATCAGHTEDASLLWNINLAPLKGVACTFCQGSPHLNWHYVLSTGKIREKLIEAGLKLGRIKDIAILGRDDSGRVTQLSLVCDKDTLKIPAKDFRNIIGPNIIRSTNFNVSVVDGDAVFEGLGWGHGVGLCQWGAYFMAKQGYTYDKILSHYYPQTHVQTLGF